jgi:hypothetical protein
MSMSASRQKQPFSQSRLLSQSGRQVYFLDAALFVLPGIGKALGKMMARSP